jgi:hypothetical protein
MFRTLRSTSDLSAAEQITPSKVRSDDRGTVTMSLEEIGALSCFQQVVYISERVPEDAADGGPE